MAVRIRLMRVGKKKAPAYRVVVADRREKRTGKYLEKIGFYSPVLPGKPLEINQERLSYWLSRGAEVSPTARKLIRRAEKNSTVNPTTGGVEK